MMIDMRQAWDENSADYQALHEISTESAHYGPWAPLESELSLLGDVSGLRILELGCGGGQSSIAFAKQGATVTGIDLSDAQIRYARMLAERAGMAVDFRQGDVTDLGQFADVSCDLVFSTYTFQYIKQMDLCLAECVRLLKASGRLVFSLDHPFRDCFHDNEEQETSIVPLFDYFDNRPLCWRFDESGVQMISYHRTMGEWFKLLEDAGFQVKRLLEPQPPVEMLDAIWPDDGALAPMRLVPQTIIIVADKKQI